MPAWLEILIHLIRYATEAEVSIGAAAETAFTLMLQSEYPTATQQE